MSARTPTLIAGTSGALVAKDWGATGSVARRAGFAAIGSAVWPAIERARRDPNEVPRGLAPTHRVHVTS